MIRAIAAAGAMLLLAGCNTTNATNVNSFIETLSKTNCHVTGSFSATVGAVNPGSGATLTTMIDCPNNGGAVTSTQTTVQPAKTPPASTLTAP